ncbi:MAG: tetratricopeptide repeat protein [Casimicrobiaceae bacterium]
MPADLPKPGRNEPCPCGSGRRYKLCHGLLATPGSPATETRSPDELARQGLAAHRRNDLDAAEVLYRAALAAAPAHAGALHYLGVVLYQRKRAEDAMPLLDRALELVPDDPEFHNNRGLALAALQRDGDAIAAHRRALALNPVHTTAWNNLGLALQASGDVVAAVEAYRAGLRIAPAYPQLHWNLALALLLQGDYAQGWPEYEWRLQCPELYSRHAVHAGPRWAGDDPAGRTLLITAEQGLGDSLQMLRFVPDVADRGARVIVAAPLPLQRLAASMPGVDAVYVEHDALPPFAAHISLMSLPHVLGITPATLPRNVPYLQPDLNRAREARVAIEHSAGSAMTIGIAWSGAPDNTNNARRSVSLAMFAPLLDEPATRWYSLKWDLDTADPAYSPVASRLVALPQRNDFDGLAALISELDLVITVDTSIAHLAGAMGKPVWVLLHHVPDWRWMLDRGDSPWYPTARLFRQRTPGDWSDPLRDVQNALRATVSGR